MGRAVSLSIEGNSVKVAYATLKGKRITIDDAFVLPYEQLDEFLSEEKIRDFIVSVDFKNFYQDTIYIPSVKRKLVKPLILSELRKKQPTEGSYTPVYFDTGQRTVEGKRVSEFFVFYVDTSEIEDLIKRFLAKGKRIKSLHPNMLAVLKILPLKETPYLCLYETGNKKNLFLIKNGKVLFTRSAQSIGEGIVDYDIQNINMTVNYCVQTLRIEPENVLFVGEAGKTSSTSMQTSVPMVYLAKPENMVVRSDLFMDFLIPIAALGKGKTQNMLTDTYKKFYFISNFVRYSTVSFIVLSIVLAGLFGINLYRYGSLNAQLDSLRLQNRNLQGVLNEYNRAKEGLQREKPLIDFMNRIHSLPSTTRLLYDMSSLRTEGMEIKNLSISSQKTDPLKLEISGKVGTRSLYMAQKRVDRTVMTLKSTQGMKEVGGTLSLKSGTFGIKAAYREEGSQ